MLKLNLDQKFENIDGGTMKEVNPMTKTEKDVTLRDVFKVAVTAELEGDAQGASQEVLNRKMKNFEIYLKIREAAESIELTAEEIVHIKERVIRVYSVLIAGPTVNMLNGKGPYGSL